MLPPMFIGYGFLMELIRYSVSFSDTIHQKLERHNGGGSSSIMRNTISMTGAFCSGAVQKTILTHVFNHIQQPDKICLAGLVGQKWIIHWCEIRWGTRFDSAYREMLHASCEKEIENQKKIMNKHTHLDRPCQSVTIDLAFEGMGC